MSELNNLIENGTPKNIDIEDEDKMMKTISNKIKELPPEVSVDKESIETDKVKTETGKPDFIKAITEQTNADTAKIESKIKRNQTIEDLEEDEERLQSILNEFEAEDQLGLSKDEIDETDRLAQLELFMEKLDEVPIVDVMDPLDKEKVIAKYPNGYVIKSVNKDYQNHLDELLDENFKPSNGSHKDKAKSLSLKRFINRGDAAIVPLPNSGISISLTGASINKIIAMMTEQQKSYSMGLLSKVNHIVQHIIDTTVGPLKMTRLIDVVSNHDLETLYYALFAATFPDVNEFPVTCDSCKQSYKVRSHNRDLLLNPDDFNDDLINIEEVETLADLKKISRLNDGRQVVLEKEGIVIKLTHPSIKSFVKAIEVIGKNINSSTMEGNLVTLYHIEELRYYDEEYGPMSYKKPFNEKSYIELDKFLTTLSLESRYILDQAIQDMIPAIPQYGIGKSTCPHCEVVNEPKIMNMSSLLFTMARDKKEILTVKEEIETLQKKKDKKK